MSFSQISLIKFLVSEQKTNVYVLQGLAAQYCSLLCRDACRQPQAAVGEWNLSNYLGNYLGKGSCGIAQASNIGCKSVSITPEDKHALIDCLSWG